MKGSLAKLFGIGSNEENHHNHIHTSKEEIIKATIPPVVEENQPTLEQNIEQQLAQQLERPQGMTMLPVEQIIQNRYQPRKTFHDQSLDELAQSIREFGVIQPLLVCEIDDRYELVAGERRLRASKLAGLSEVPVIIKQMSTQEMAEIAMIENLQREDLHFLEEAEGYNVLLNSFGMTQEELAKRLGKSQSTIANKLRILKLAPEVRGKLAGESFTERHARALLKLNDVAQQLNVVEEIASKQLNVRETELFIEQMANTISREIEQEKQQRVIRVIKDVRLFINSIRNVVGEMKKVGLHVNMEQIDQDDHIVVQLKIPKRK